MAVYIIAEAGVNHNGSMDMALKLVDAAAAAGADAVKFQTFKADSVVSTYAPKAEYQKKTTGVEESQLEMVRKLELNQEAHVILKKHSLDRGIDFLSTPFDEKSVAFLVDDLGLAVLKIASGEITNAPLLLDIAKRGCRVYLSTGMSTLGDIENALGVLAFGYLQRQEPSLDAFQQAYFSNEGQDFLRKNVTLLHCTTEYPAPFDDVNLRAIETMKQCFGFSVGYSDHTKGISVPIAAVALGATVIEKHFTLDNNLPGPDHKASLDVNELYSMVRGVREVEKALGNGKKIVACSEFKNRTIARKSLVAREDLIPGTVVTEKELASKRPGDGLSPYRLWEVLGKETNVYIKKDVKIKWENLH